MEQSNSTQPANDSLLPGRVSSVAALISGVLAVIKVFTYWNTGSLIVALSAFDSAIDVIVSFINSQVIRFARQAADVEHPYGHGKAESIAGLGQAALISGAALTVFTSSLQKLYNYMHHGALPHGIMKPWLAGFFFIVALFSAVNAAVLTYFSKKFKSPALSADARHYSADVVSNLGSAISVALIIYLQKPWLDALIAGLLSLYIAWSGIHLFRETIDELMDHDVSSETKKKALETIGSVSEKIVDVHRFRGRKSGPRLFFDFHITLPDTLSFREIHDISDMVETRLSEEFDADVTVHVDPESLPVASAVSLSRRTGLQPDA